MEQNDYERLARLEQIQTNSIKIMDAHVTQDMIMLGEIRNDIKDIYGKLSRIVIKQTRLETIFWLVGALIVLLTPIITAFVVATMLK